MNLETFIQKYKEDALQIDLEKDVIPRAKRIFFKRVYLLENAEFESEKTEILEDIKNGIIASKNFLINSLQSGRFESDKGRDFAPQFIQNLRLYLEYKELYDNANIKVKTELFQNDEDTPETDLQTKIKLHFDFFQKNCPRKHKQILKDEDFEKLIKWTIFFFENGFKVPEIDTPINKVETNKTYVQGAFKALFKEIQKSSTYPTSLFDFYNKAFIEYANDTKNNFDKARINEEVNKLMNIEY